jgi:hypothetical protein
MAHPPFAGMLVDAAVRQGVPFKAVDLADAKIAPP